jgi:DnaJ domain
MTDFYKILGVSRDASAEEIRKAYKRLARKYHPDMRPGDKDAAAKFKKVQRIYATLRDPEKRARYDRRYAQASDGGRPSGSASPPVPPNQVSAVVTAEWAPQRARVKSPIAIAGAACVGLGVLVGIAWTAFELGRRQSRARVEPPRAQANLMPQPPAVIVPAPAPPLVRFPVVAQRPQNKSLVAARPVPQPPAAPVIPKIPASDKEDKETEALETAIARGHACLAASQSPDGSFQLAEQRVGFGGMARNAYPVGPTALATLALLKSGATADDPVVASALKFLRGRRLPEGTYEASLVLMALVAANEWDEDRRRIVQLRDSLVRMQTTVGAKSGMWNYGQGKYGGGREDNSNTQFAILGLGESTRIPGVRVKRKTWELASKHFVDHQNKDGGWGYYDGDSSTGSMTCTAIASLLTCSTMLRDQGPASAARERAVQRGIDWLDQHFAVGVNPGHGATFVFYYLYGVERVGRLSGRRFFGKHDWYREGAAYLFDGQSQGDGGWNAPFTAAEAEKVIGTSFALLFLSKG